jgi:phosphatidylglycerophosphatase A
MDCDYDKITAMKGFFGFMHKIIATVFFIGYIPFAPGTFGSLAALAVVWIFKPDAFLLLIILAVAFAAGIVSSHSVEKNSGLKDNSRIVIDEFVGYLFAVAFLPLNIGYIIAAFVLFRFLDVLKPPPIKNLERMFSGGIGVMIDDMAAGIITNIILQAWKLAVMG